MGVPGNADLLLLKTAAAAGGYQVSRSLRFNGSVDNSYLSRTPASAGNRKTWTWSGWVKRSSLGTYQVPFGYMSSSFADQHYLRFTDTDTLDFAHYTSGAYQGRLVTTQVFRDTGAWFHVVAIWDTTSATAGDRMRLYINGSEITAFSTDTNPSQNYDGFINTIVEHDIGRYVANGNAGNQHYFNGYLADIWFLDGIAATPSDFAETDATTGQWIPKTYSGSKGSNGFHLEFADNSAATATTLGKDTANSNNWTPNNFSVTAGAGNDSLVDTPSSYGTDDSLGGSVRGNYATINPLAGSTIHTVSNGNLTLTATDANWSRKISTIGMSSGKWYAEFTLSTAGNNTNQVGVVSFIPPVNGSNQNGEETGQSMYNGYNSGTYNGTIFVDGSRVLTGQTTASSGDVIGVALDASSNNVKYYRNGTLVGSSSGYTPTNVSGTWYFVVQCNNSGVVDCNFGQRAWAYTPPANHKALVDTNLTAPVIAKPNTVMDVALYTGNGSGANTFLSTGPTVSTGFSPDLVWIKSRSLAKSHVIHDTVRGETKRLYSDLTNGEFTYDHNKLAFNSNGIQITTNDDNYNNNNSTYAAWLWDAGSSTVTNTQGSITSSVRANQSAGFSIVSYAGGQGSTFTVGHGLNVQPAFVITKARNANDNWGVYYTNNGVNTNWILLNSTAAQGTNNGPLAGGAYMVVNSTTLQIASNAYANGGSSMIAYCFAPVTGYSSFGSYVGNGSTDGPFVYTGFRPAFVMLKSAIGNNANWTIVDNKRDTYNVAKTRLFPSDSQAENTGADNVDILSNGFKLRVTEAGANASGGTYIYACFAENPFQYARAR